MIKWIIQVKPVIVYPHCYIVEKKQDCFKCDFYEFKTCKSPRGLCVKAYYNHKKGCPNYNKKEGCPPCSLLFNEVYDPLKPVYAIYNIFDFKNHIERMKVKHLKWSQRQLECCLYWQGKARKQLRERIEIFEAIFKEYVITNCPEGMGVNVTKTMKNVGIEIEWPPRNVTYQIAFAGQPREE